MGGGGGGAPSIRSAPAASTGAIRAPASAGAINRAPATAAGAVNRAPAVKGAANPAVRAAGQTAYVNRAGAAYNSRYPYANRYANGGYYNGYHHGYHSYYPYYHHYHYNNAYFWTYFGLGLAYDFLRPWGWWGYGAWGPGYGYGYGNYGYPAYGYGGSGYSDPGTIYQRPAAPAPENVPPPTDALIEVLVPSEDARVWLDGYATTSRGTERRFSSPPLEGGQDYSYLVKASWITDEGQLRTAQRQVPIRAGARVVVDFTQAPQPPPPLPKPKANVPELE